MSAYKRTTSVMRTDMGHDTSAKQGIDSGLQLGTCGAHVLFCCVARLFQRADRTALPLGRFGIEPAIAQLRPGLP